MLTTISKLIMHKQLKFEEGTIQLLKQNVAIFPFDTFYNMQKLLCDSGKSHEVYLLSKNLGRQWIENLFKEYTMNKISDQAKWGEKVFTLAGMGKMKVIDHDVKTKTMTYRVYTSVMSKYYGNVGFPVDHVPRGWFAGAACVFFKSDVDAVETKCVSKGDKYCEFIIKPKSQFDFNNELVASQLSK